MMTVNDFLDKLVALPDSLFGLAKACCWDFQRLRKLSEKASRRQMVTYLYEHSQRSYAANRYRLADVRNMLADRV